MNWIKISAYFNGNAGDDLMVETLMKRYPKACFWESTSIIEKPKSFLKYRFYNKEDILKKYGRINHLINIISFYKKKDIFYKFIFKRIEKKSICSVYIGGSIFIQRIGENINNRSKEENDRRIKDKPFFIIGANFGPYVDQSFYDYYYQYFKECTGVSFRDKASYELFSNLSNTQWAPDVVFNIPKGKVCDHGRVLISVIDFGIRPHLQTIEKDFISKISEICKYVVDIKLIPVLVAFCKNEGDKLMIGKIRKNLSPFLNTKVEEYVYCGDTDQIVDLYRNASFVVATRFHSMVLGMRFNKPMFVISYDIKTDNVLNDSNFDSKCDIKSIGDFPVSKMFDLGYRHFNHESYFCESNLQFKQIDQLLKK